jgi:hypothetical protein
MASLRLSLVSAVFAVVSSLALGGCAVDGANAEAEPDPEGEAAGSGEDVGTTSQALTASPTLTPTQGLTGVAAVDLSDIQIVMPACRAVLVSSGPAIRNEPNEWGCPAANPYVGQERFAGNLESGLTVLRDEAKPGQLRCAPSKIVGGGITCTKTTDRLIEKLCTETRTYECPCGVESVTVDGALVAQCRSVAR